MIYNSQSGVLVAAGLIMNRALVGALRAAAVLADRRDRGSAYRRRDVNEDDDGDSVNIACTGRQGAPLDGAAARAARHDIALAWDRPLVVAGRVASAGGRHTMLGCTYVLVWR